jgi:hypothetical protein
MAKSDTDPGMKREARHVHGPRQIAALIPGVTRAAFRRHSPAVAQVIADWDSIVGPAIAGVSSPRRMSSGTLTIACTGPVAIELQHLSRELICRINTHLGSQTVAALRFVQTVPPQRPQAAPLPPPVPAVAEAEAEKSVTNYPEGELRRALVSLGRAVLGRSLR